MAWAMVAFRASGRLHTRHARADNGIGVNRTSASHPPPDTDRRIERFRCPSSFCSSRRMAAPISLRRRFIIVDSEPAALTRNVRNVPAAWRPMTPLIVVTSRLKYSCPSRAFGRGMSNRSTRCTATALRRPSRRSAGPEYLIDIRPSFGYPVRR